MTTIPFRVVVVRIDFRCGGIGSDTVEIVAVVDDGGNFTDDSIAVLPEVRSKSFKSNDVALL